MSTLATSENKTKTKKLELRSIFGALYITFSTIKDGKWVIEWSRPHTSISRAGLWYRKYEEGLLKLSPEEQHQKINVYVSASGEVSLSEDA